MIATNSVIFNPEMERKSPPVTNVLYLHESDTVLFTICMLPPIKFTKLQSVGTIIIEVALFVYVMYSPADPKYQECVCQLDNK